MPPISYWALVEKCRQQSGGKASDQFVFEALDSKLEKVLVNGEVKTERKSIFNLCKDLLYLVRDLNNGRLSTPIYVDTNFKPADPKVSQTAHKKSLGIVDNYFRLKRKLAKNPMLKSKWEHEKVRFLTTNELDPQIWDNVVSAVHTYLNNKFGIDASDFSVLENPEIELFRKRRRLEKSFQNARIITAESVLALCKKCPVVDAPTKMNIWVEHDFNMSEPKSFPRPIRFSFEAAPKMKPAVQDALLNSFILVIPRVRYSSDCRLVFVAPAKKEIVIEDNYYCLKALLEERYAAKDCLNCYKNVNKDGYPLSWNAFEFIQRHIFSDLTGDLCVYKDKLVKKNVVSDATYYSSSTSSSEEEEEMEEEQSVPPPPAEEERETTPTAEEEEATPAEVPTCLRDPVGPSDIGSHVFTIIEPRNTPAAVESTEEEVLRTVESLASPILENIPPSPLKRPHSDENMAPSAKRLCIPPGLRAADKMRDTYLLQYDIRENGINEHGSHDIKDNPNAIFEMVGAGASSRRFSVTHAREMCKKELYNDEILKRFRYFTQDERHRNESMMRLAELDTIYCLFQDILKKKIAHRESGYTSDDEFATAPVSEITYSILHRNIFMEIFKENANFQIIRPLLADHLVRMSTNLNAATAAHKNYDETLKSVQEDRDSHKNALSAQKVYSGNLVKEIERLQAEIETLKHKSLLSEQTFSQKELDYMKKMEEQKELMAVRDIRISELEHDLQTQNDHIMQLQIENVSMGLDEDEKARFKDSVAVVVKYMTMLSSFHAQVMNHVSEQRINDDIAFIADVLNNFTQRMDHQVPT